MTSCNKTFSFPRQKTDCVQFTNYLTKHARMGLSCSSEQFKMVATSKEDIDLQTTGDTTTSMMSPKCPPRSEMYLHLTELFIKQV